MVRSSGKSIEMSFQEVPNESRLGNLLCDSVSCGKKRKGYLVPKRPAKKSPPALFLLRDALTAP